MKNFILFSVLLFSTQVYSQQIKLPKLPQISNPFKKNMGKSFSVKWSCPQEEYKEVAQLATEADVEVFINNKGEVRFRPNVFKVKPLSKEFVQGLNPLKLVKSKKTYKVDYADCVSEFYNKVEREHQNLKKNCEGDASEVCSLNTKDFVVKARHAVESSRYMTVKDGTVLLPKTLPGSNITTLSSEAIQSGLKDFCEMGSIKSKQDLLSGSALREIDKNSSKYPIVFPGLDCLGKYQKLWISETDKLLKEYCNEEGSHSACATLRDRQAMASSIIDEATTKMKKNVEMERKNFETKYGSLEIGKDVGEHLKTNFKFPEGECNYSNRETINGRQLDVSRFDQEISDNLESIFSSGTAECQRRFLQNYISAKIQTGIDDKKFSDYCKLHQTEYCKKIQGSPDLVLKNIERMMALVHGDLGQRVYNEEIACHVDETSSIEDILGKLKDNEKAVRCSELKDGEFKAVNWRQNQNVTSGEYTLKRVGENKFEAYFNLAFSSDEGVATTGPQMMKRAQECMATVSPYLKGPNGEVLEIKILEEDEINNLPNNQRPPKKTIRIAKKGFRSNPLMYEENVDCPVITHEILHLFGLCDEYKEQFGVNGNNYACRVVPEGPSVMKNQHDMFAVAVDKNSTCDCSSSTCQSIMKSNNSEKVQFYLGKSIYEMTDYVNRSKYCQTSGLRAVNYSSLASKDMNVVITANFSNKIEIENRELDGNPDRVFRSKITCSCEPSDKDCLGFLSSTRNSVENSQNEISGTCPSGTNTKNQGIGKNGNDPYGYDDEKKLLVVNKKAKAPSLLHPAHFEKILGGSCEDKAKIYNECAQFAYRDGNCNVPEYCKDNSKFLGIKQ